MREKTTGTFSLSGLPFDSASLGYARDKQGGWDKRGLRSTRADSAAAGGASSSLHDYRQDGFGLFEKKTAVKTANSARSTRAKHSLRIYAQEMGSDRNLRHAVVDLLQG